MVNNIRLHFLDVGWRLRSCRGRRFDGLRSLGLKTTAIEGIIGIVIPLIIEDTFNLNGLPPLRLIFIIVIIFLLLDLVKLRLCLFFLFLQVSVLFIEVRLDPVGNFVLVKFVRSNVFDIELTFDWVDHFLIIKELMFLVNFGIFKQILKLFVSFLYLR